MNIKNNDEYNNILNDLVKKFNIKNEKNIGQLYLKLEEFLDKDVDMFLKAWNYIVVKYVDYVCRTDDESISDEVCDLLLCYI